MLRALDAEYVVFDVETTGLSPLDGDRIIELAAVRVRRGVIVDRYHSFVDPRRPLNKEAQRLADELGRKFRQIYGYSKRTRDRNQKCQRGRNKRTVNERQCPEYFLDGVPLAGK